MRFYVATSFDNWREAATYAAALEHAGHTITLDWWKHHPDNAPKCFKPDLEAIACAEVEAVASADALIVLLPGGRGTHTELGIAIGLGTPVVIVGMTVHDNPPPFYFTPGVWRVPLAPFDWALADMATMVEFIVKSARGEESSLPAR